MSAEQSARTRMILAAREYVAELESTLPHLPIANSAISDVAKLQTREEAEAQRARRKLVTIKAEPDRAEAAEYAERFPWTIRVGGFYVNAFSSVEGARKAREKLLNTNCLPL